jgi:hypothetical protein
MIRQTIPNQSWETMRQKHERSALDLYYLKLERKTATFQAGTGHE